jgi:hypothetical protein
MLWAMPNSRFSHDFTGFDRRGTPIARADRSNRLETAKMAVGGAHCEAHRKGWASKEFFLEEGDDWVVTVVQKPSS